jgi:hypothetical protein
VGPCCSRHALVEGRPRPRVETHAPYALSRSQEAVDWAAGAGLIPDDWQDDSLDRICAVDPAGRWVHFECCEFVPRQNGKGSILEIRALAGLFVFGEELIMWSAHEYKTAQEAFRRCLKLLRRIGVQVGNNENLLLVEGRHVKVSHTNGEEGFELIREPDENGDLVLMQEPRRLKFIARSKGSGRGFSGDCNIIDETFAYTYSQQEALLFTMGARANPQIIYTSSPPLDGITGDIMFDLRLRGDPSAPRELEDGPWSQDPSLSYRDWGLAGDLEDLSGIDLDDPDVWLATNPSMDVVRAGGASALTAQSIARERRAFRSNPGGFCRERFGVWPKRIRSAGGVIPLELWRELATTPEESGRPEDVAFAVVVAPDRSATWIAAAGCQSDGRVQGVIIDRLRGTAGVVERMAKLRERWDPITWAIEDKGETASLWPDLERATDDDGLALFKVSADKDDPKRGEVAVPWANDLAAAYGLFIDLLVEKRFAHLSDDPLNVAATVATTRLLGTGTAWDYKDPAAAPIRAVTQAVWGYLTRFDAVASANPWDHVY